MRSMSKKQLNWSVFRKIAILLSLGSALTVAASSLAPYSSKSSEDKWFACQADEECIVVPRSSCVPQSAVNRKYLDDYKSWVADFESRAECSPPAPDNPNAAARCVNKVCKVVVPKPRQADR